MGGGCENTLSLLELVAILEKILKKKIDIRFDDWRKFDQKVYISDTGKVQKALNWAPSVNPEEGVRRIVEWIEGHPGLF